MLDATRRTPRPRPVLDGMASYVPKPPRPPAAGPSYRLFLNENPYPPLPSVLGHLAEAASAINHYPGVVPERLVDALARKLDVPPAHVLTGPGSVGIYQQMGQAMLAPGDEVVYAWPSFEAFPIVVRIAGAVPVEVPLDDDGTHDLTAMARAITARTRAVLLCEPNNPTGTAVGTERLERFLEQVPSHVLVVLDEAYFEFHHAPDHPDGVRLHHDHPNLLVLRTFSKAYGLAGLRVGYGVAHPEVADALRKCAVPCGVSGLAEQAALASLAAERELFARVDQVVAERERLRTDLYGCLPTGPPMPRSETNFLWLPLGSAAEDFSGALARQGLLTRAFPDAGVRVTVGSRTANDLLVRRAERIAADSGRS